MILAQVIGTVVTPVQHPSLAGKTLLRLRTVTPGGDATGQAFIGVDGCGAGQGDRVLVIDEGNSARQLLGLKDAPIRTVVVGVVDYVEGPTGQLLYGETCP